MDAGDEITKLPLSTEEQRFQSWVIKYTKSHILSSKCTNDPECVPQETPESDLCPFCMYNCKLELPHLPDMVFASNVLTLKHDSGFGLEFNALDSLKKVSNGKMVVKIACSESWIESRADSGYTESVVKPFDWTFSTDYKGTLEGEWVVEETQQKIDIKKLQQKEEIMFYHDLTLFEDELHDNGTAVFSVKIRVMPSSFFLLLRYFLRVDNVLIKINDTRYYHEFETRYLLREYTSREAKVSDLKVPTFVMLDPTKIAEHLPVIKEVKEKLILPD